MKIKVKDSNKSGVDRQSIHESITSKSSKSLPIPPETFTSGDNVRPNDKEKTYTSV